MATSCNHWRGEGRQSRRTGFRRLTFWPTVDAVTTQGGIFFEVCRFPRVPEFGVEACSNGSPCGLLDYLQSPPHSVITEVDYVSPWDAQQRALWLEVSVQAPILAPHMDMMFFENFIHDRQHPVPHEDLIELGICAMTKEAVYPEYEVTQVNDQQILSPHAPDGGPCCDRPDSTAPQILPDPPGSQDGSQTGGERDRDQRLPLHGFPEWTTTLWNMLQQEGVVDTPGEGPTISLETFYISHRYHWQEENSRVVRLNQNYEQWMRKIVETWKMTSLTEEEVAMFLS